MKINANKLYTFLKKVTLDGEIGTANLILENGTMRIWVKSTDSAVAINSELKGINGINSTWSIKDTKMLLKSLKLFTNDVEIQQTNNKLSIYDKDRQIDIVLADESFIDNNLTKKLALEYNNKTRMNTAILKQSIENKRIVNAQMLTLKCENNVLSISAGSKSFDTITEKQQFVYENFTTTFSEPLNSVVTQLDDTAEVGFKSDYPATFRIFNDEYDIQFVVAHIMELEGK